MDISLKRLLNNIYVLIVRRVYLFEKRISFFSVIAVIAFPLYYIIWHDVFPQPYENLWLRLFGSAIFIPFMFASYWPQNLIRYKPIYWYVATLYGLPFFFTFMLLKNDGTTVWLLSTMVAVFLMVLMLDWMTLLIQFGLGVPLAWTAYYFTTETHHIDFATLESIPIYLFAIILGSVTNYSSEILQKERLRAMLAAASNIAHELRTPLMGIRTGAAGIRQYLPALLDSYQLAKVQGVAVPRIRLAHFQAMQGVLDRIEEEAEHSSTIIDMLLMNTRTDWFVTENVTQCSMKQCVETAIQRYTFASEKEKQALDWNSDADDFQFRGVELLMVHVLFNLMKNAYFYIAKAGKGEITIQLKKTPQANLLVFRDTATGIPAEVLPNIFNRFYSWAPEDGNGLGTGIGLSFCRSVIESFGGSISCQSTLGEYTEFILTFPLLPNQEKNL